MTLESSASIESATAAGLHYLNDEGPGIRRKRAGTAFSYIDDDGQRIRDRQVLARIKALAIPPAWTDVWICADPDGHIQATGRDARRRKQYRYHPRWHAVRDTAKYERLAAFAEALPRIRDHVEEDLRLRGIPRRKVLALVIKLLQDTSIRIGNDEYRRENRSFGLTTMLDRHAHFEGQRLRFEFKGKSGKQHGVERFPNLERHRSGDALSENLRGADVGDGRQAACLGRDQERRAAVGQHSGGVPQGICPPCRAERLPRRVARS
ncbi:MAG: hypothetical protein LC797_10955 [Chloroflexi bacterium]|nr:hypothetical protein [Chloroflexota bacterium]